MGIVGASEVLNSLAEKFPGTETPYPDFVKWNEIAVEHTGKIQDLLLDKPQQLEINAAVACAKQEAQRRGTDVNHAIAGAQILVVQKSEVKKAKSLATAFQTAEKQLAHAKQPAAE